MNSNFIPVLFPGPQAPAEEDDFNVVGGEIFATFSSWASWLSDGNPFSPVPMTLLPAVADGSAGAPGDPGSTVAVTSGGITINLLFDAAAMAAPAGFRAGIQQAVAIMAAAISDKITVNIKIDYSGTGGGAAAGPDHGLYESYSWVRANLINNATPGDTTFNALTAGSTIQGQSNVAVWNAQLKLWGVIGANDTTTDDGAATFATDINPSLLVGVALHELTHAMGRIPFGTASQPDIFDFFRFTNPGTRLFLGGATAPAAYFSLDGGNTKVADYGRTSDASDFLNSGVQGPNDPFNEFYNGGTLQQLTAADLKQLVALGFHLLTADTISPSLVHNGSITVPVGATATISSSQLQFDDNVSGHAQETFTILNGPTHGVLQKNGSVTTSFTQADIDNGLIAYHETGNVASADSFTFKVTDDAGNATGTAQFQINVTAVAGSVSITDVTVTEGNSGITTATFAVVRNFGTTAFSVNYSTVDGSATVADGDYIPAIGTLTFGAGVNMQTFSILVNADTRHEPDEIFYVNLWGATNGATISDSQGSALIRNDDPDHAPVIDQRSGPVPTASFHGQTFQMQTLFTVSDADRDPLSYYILDNTPGGATGHFQVGGVTQPEGQWIALTQAQFNQTTFVTGQSGADDVYLEAFDPSGLYGFNGVHVVAAANHTPVIDQRSGPTPAASFHGQVFQMETLFTVSDPDNDPLTYYILDNTPGASSGHFQVAGVTQPEGQWIALTQAQFNQTTYVTGQSGVDDVYLEAADPGGLLGYNGVHVAAAANHTPVIDQRSGSTPAASFQGQVFQMETLFTVSDPDNDPLTYYILDNTPGASSGHFQVGGVTQPEGQWIALTQAQFNQTTFVTGQSGVDDVYLEAFDPAGLLGFNGVHVVAHDLIV